MRDTHPNANTKVLINYISRIQEEGSVMSHSETTVRDPIFYRWHAYIDDIFQHYKRKLKAYTKDEVCKYQYAYYTDVKMIKFSSLHDRVNASVV